MRGCNRYQREWIETWTSLTKMEGLVFLRIEMNTVGRESVTGVWEVSDLEIMRVVQIPETLLVVMEDESARRMRRLIKGPNLNIVGILEEEVQFKTRAIQLMD